MEPVRNFRKYMQKTSDSIGFKAVDEATVEVTLSKAYTYFLSYLASYVWSVVDPAVLEAKARRILCSRTPAPDHGGSPSSMQPHRW